MTTYVLKRKQFGAFGSALTTAKTAITNGAKGIGTAINQNKGKIAAGTALAGGAALAYKAANTTKDTLTGNMNKVQ